MDRNGIHAWFSMFGAGALAPPTPPPPNTVSLTPFSYDCCTTAGSTSAIHSHSEWNEQFGRKLGGIGQHRYVQSAVCGGNLHRNCDQCSSPPKSSSATVTVAAQISISISPTTNSLRGGAQQLLVAMISGTSNTAVTWSASAGTIASNGTYTAPSTAGNYSVTALSVADPTKLLQR